MLDDRHRAALGLLRVWAADIATASSFPGADWTVGADASLHGVVVGEADTEIWADYLGIDLARTEAGTLSGRRDKQPQGPFGPVIPVVLTSA